MKKNSGFTLLEVALVTVILGIVAGLTFLKFMNTTAQDQLQKAANNLYIEIRGLRPLCFKYDEAVMVTFDDNNSKLEIYIDQNDDEKIQAAELYKEYVLPSPVIIGSCETDPDTWVYGEKPKKGLTNEWQDMLTVLPDARGEYAHGGVYINVPSLKTVTYFIGITTSMQSIELFKWTGSSWIKL